MSKKKNAKREAYQKKQEEQGKAVVNWIFGILVLIAIIWMIISFVS